MDSTQKLSAIHDKLLAIKEWSVSIHKDSKFIIPPLLFPYSSIVQYKSNGEIIFKTYDPVRNSDMAIEFSANGFFKIKYLNLIEGKYIAIDFYLIHDAIKVLLDNLDNFIWAKREDIEICRKRWEKPLYENN